MIKFAYTVEQYQYNALTMQSFDLVARFRINGSINYTPLIMFILTVCWLSVDPERNFVSFIRIVS